MTVRLVAFDLDGTLTRGPTCPEATAAAAVGDSHGDVPMLRACGTSVFVGTDLPDGFTPTLHLPAAPIDEVARRLLATA